MLELKNIFQKFNNQEILSNINLSLSAGEVLTLIGPSGGGKTSLLKICALLNRPISGDIIIDDKICVRNGRRIVKPHSIWPKVTIIFQNLYLWPHLTARDNIALPHKDFDNQEKRLRELCELFDLNPHLNKYPNELSAGQKQRVAIVRALLLNPGYILMDEITASLDVEQAFNILEILAKLKNEKVGIILVTHYLEFAKRISDQIAFLDNGRIIDIGGPEMIDNPKNERVAIFVNKLRTLQ
ncbi:MAG: ATP-binding cassette domain-containing protein [Leadbetterella sp.]|nr:ATP-binding cassette domain-containing protein [Leadbetterella sp.]